MIWRVRKAQDRQTVVNLITLTYKLKVFILQTPDLLSGHHCEHKTNHKIQFLGVILSEIWITRGDKLQEKVILIFEDIWIEQFCTLCPHVSKLYKSNIFILYNL